MTDEERQRMMDFLLEQQAHSDARMSRLEEHQQRHEEVLQRIEAVQEQTARQIEHLSAAMIELVEAQSRTEALSARTDERLNALIHTVERHISESHDGKA